MIPFDQVAAMPYSIGYSVLQDVIAMNLAKANMINKAGNIVTATSDSVAFAVMEKGGSLNSLLNAVLADGASSRVWPIAGYTYFIIRMNAHLGSCKERTAALSFLYNFYYSETDQQIAARLGFATLPNFIRDIVVNVLLNAKCSDGTYALASYRKVQTPVLSTTVISPLVQIYQSAYYNLDSSTSWLLNTYSVSEKVWQSFSLQSANYTGAFTMFSSMARKKTHFETLSSTNGFSNGLLTAAFAHVAIVPLYHCLSYTSKTSVPLQLTADILAKIYTGQIRFWNDSSIQNANPATRHFLPHSRIVVNVRSGANDANTLFSRFLGTRSATFRAIYGLGNYPDGNSTLNFPSVLPMDNYTVYVPDNTHMDASVTFYDNSIGYFLQTGSPNSNVAAYCNDPTCSLPIFPSSTSIKACEADPNTFVSYSSSSSVLLSYDLMNSNASNCYPIVGTVDYSVMSGQDPTCSDGATGMAYIRVAFSSWMFSSSALVQPLSSNGAAGPSDVMRAQAYTQFCNIKCGGRYLGYTYCNYRDCTWDSGDFIQVVSDCDPSTSLRTVTYVLKHASTCIQNPSKMPASPLHISCEYVDSASSIGIAAYVVSIFGALLSGCVLALSIMRRNDRKIVKSHPVFVYIFIVGAILLNLSSLTFIGPNTDTSCLLRPWVFNMCLTAMFAPIVMKLYTVDKLYHNPKLKKILVTDSRVMKEVLWLLSIDVVILLIWSIVETPREVDENNSYSGVQQGVVDRVCNTGLNQISNIIMMVYKICIFMVGIMKAICTWHVTAEISEAKQFAVAITIGGISYLMNLFLSFSSSSVVIVQVFGTFICANLSVILIMIPKFSKRKTATDSAHPSAHPSMGGGGGGGAIGSSHASSMVSARDMEEKGDNASKYQVKSPIPASGIARLEKTRTMKIDPVKDDVVLFNGEKDTDDLDDKKIIPTLTVRPGTSGGTAKNSSHTSDHGQDALFVKREGTP